MSTTKSRAAQRPKTGTDSTFLYVDRLPCHDQSSDSIHAWAQKLAVGGSVIRRQSYGHTQFEYKFGKVEAITDNGRRVLIEGVGTFWRTPNAAGKYCHAPKGQLTMVEPTSATKKAARSGLIHVEK
jgi:hypothetical protein